MITPISLEFRDKETNELIYAEEAKTCTLTQGMSASEAPRYIGNIIGNIQVANFTSNCNIVDTDKFNSLFNPPHSNSFTMKYDVPILIQTKYHRKSRINKKWIKRYGFKKDVIHCEAPICKAEITPQEKDDIVNFDIEYSEIQMTFPKSLLNNDKLVWTYGKDDYDLCPN